MTTTTATPRTFIAYTYGAVFGLPTRYVMGAEEFGYDLDEARAVAITMGLSPAVYDIQVITLPDAPTVSLVKAPHVPTVSLVKRLYTVDGGAGPIFETSDITTAYAVAAAKWGAVVGGEVMPTRFRSQVDGGLDAYAMTRPTTQLNRYGMAWDGADYVRTTRPLVYVDGNGEQFIMTPDREFI